MPSVSGMKVNKQIGINDRKNDPAKLSTWPNFSTVIWPKKLDKVAPKPKQLADSPTIQKNA
jgi:hypothetical protein